MDDEDNTNENHKSSNSNANELERLHAEFGDEDPEDYRDATESRKKYPIFVRTLRLLWRRRIFWEGWEKLTELVLAGLIFLATATQAYIYWQQTNLMRDSLTQNENSIILGRGQLAAAARSATAAENANKNSRDQFIQDSRPWLGIDAKCDTCGRFRPDGSLEVVIKGAVSNSGRTPAVGIDFRTAIVKKPRRDPIPTIDSAIKEEQSPLTEMIREMPPRGERELIGKISKSIERTSSLQPFITIAPNVTRPFDFGNFVIPEWKFDPKPGATLDVVYAIGEITYYGPDRNTRYKTSFCMETTHGSPNFTFCRGNDMR